MPKKTHLTQKEIERKTLKGLKKYKKLDFLGQFAMFMGTVQLLEIELKNLLVNKYGCNLETIENWTLGMTTNELEKKKLRNDLVYLLKNLVQKRNYVAHELLANEFITLSFFRGSKHKKHYSKDFRFLHKSMYELEQLIVLLKAARKRDAWG